jgi:hypothetical protein
MNYASSIKIKIIKNYKNNKNKNKTDKTITAKMLTSHMAYYMLHVIYKNITRILV